MAGLGLATDVSNAEQVKSMVDQTLAKFGRVDVLVNVAGGSYSRNPYMPSFKRAPLARPRSGGLHDGL